MTLPSDAIGLHVYPRSGDGASYSLIRSCDQSSFPDALSSAISSRRVPVANSLLPTISGVECGPAPCEKSTLSVAEGYLYSQTVLPFAASSAVTTSSWLRRTYDTNPPAGRYIV